MTGFLILAAAAVIYALICLARPHHTCSRCHGTRITRKAGRRTRCRACRGTGIKTRPGARLVHGFYQHVKGEPDRTGRMNRINRVQAAAEHERVQAERERKLESIPGRASARDDDEERWPES
jgi:DnaJ-class molecular chaperone